jgi:hypothetical protein
VSLNTRAVPQTLGLLLLLYAAINLVGVAFTNMEGLISPAAVVVRYSLLAIAGIGYMQLRKWGPLVYLCSLLMNWASFFALYEGHESLGPLWLAIPVPITVLVLSYMFWGQLK